MEPTLIQGDFVLANKLVYELTDPRRGDIVNFIFPHPEMFGRRLVTTPILRDFQNIVFVKRVIGLPGDVISFHDGRLSINGKPLRYRFVRKSGNYTVYYEYIPRKDGVIKHLVQYQTSGKLNPLALIGRYGVIASAIPTQDCLKVSPMSGTICYSGRYGRVYCPTICSEIKVPKGYYFVMGDNRDDSDDSRFWGFVKREYILSTPFVIFFSGEVPELNPTDNNPFAGVLQFLHALLHPYWNRIGKPLIY
jgi:signal peptidase I